MNEIEKIGRKVGKKVLNPELGFVDDEGVFFADGKLLIAKKSYDVNKVKSIDPDFDIPSTIHHATDWKNRLSSYLEAPVNVTVYIPKLFWKTVGAFKNVRLKNATSKGRVYDVGFLPDKIVVTDYKEDDATLNFAEGYTYTGEGFFIPVYNLYYLKLVKPKVVQIKYSKGSSMAIAFVTESYNKNLEGTEILIASRKPEAMENKLKELKHA